MKMKNLKKTLMLTSALMFATVVEGCGTSAKATAATKKCTSAKLP
jgi:hypothetical protein